MADTFFIIGNAGVLAVDSLRQIDSGGIINTLIITSSDALFINNGGFGEICGIAADAAGQLYVACDFNIHGIYVVDHNSLVATRIIGVVALGESGVPGPASAAGLDTPTSMALDAAGNIYIADKFNILCVNRQGTTQTLLNVSIPAGNVANVAGTYNVSGSTGDGGPATSALFNFQGTAKQVLALDSAGNVFVADTFNHVIRRIDHATGIVTTVAGNGGGSISGDGGLATSAQISSPIGIATDAAGNLYISTTGGFVSFVRAVNMQGSPQTLLNQNIPANCIQTVAGTGVFGSTGDGGQATSAQIAGPFPMVLDVGGNLLMGQPSDVPAFPAVRLVSTSGVISRIAGTYVVGNTGDGGPATSAKIQPVRALGLAPAITPPATPCVPAGSNGVYVSDLTLFVGPATALYTNLIPNSQLAFTETTNEGRTAIVLDFNQGQGLNARDLGTIFSWPLTSKTVLDVWQPSLIQLPEGVYSRATDWIDGGTPGAKFIQGVRIEADSFNVGKTFQLQSSDDLSLHSLNEIPATFNGQSVQAFSCTPFVAHSVRVVSTDGVQWRVWSTKLVFEPWPESCETWQTEMTSLGFTGWGHVRELNIAYVSNATVTVTLTFPTDSVGSPMVLTLPNTSGIQAKTKLTAKGPNKFKLCALQATSTAPFRIFAGDVEMKVKAWGSTGAYQILKPFGGPTRTGAIV